MSSYRHCAVLLGLALAACSNGDDTDYRGRVAAAAEKGDDPTRDRWVVTIDLDSGAVGGSPVVQVAFDAPELTCADGAAVSPDELTVGSRLSFVRVGDDYDAMSPPIIGARTLRASC